MEEAAGNSEEAVFYFDKPSLLLRTKSTLIDAVVLIGLMLLMSWVLNGLDVTSGAVRGICLVLVWCYEPVFTSIKQTLGQYLMGIRVNRLSGLRNGNPQRPISIPASFVRFVLKVLLGWVSLLTIHSDQYGQAIHDKAANSVMVLAA